MTSGIAAGVCLVRMIPEKIVRHTGTKITTVLSCWTMCGRCGTHSAAIQFVHDQVRGTGRNLVFGLSHRLSAAWSIIWSKRAPKELHFGYWSPLYSIESKGTPGLNSRLLTDRLKVRFLPRPSFFFNSLSVARIPFVATLYDSTNDMTRAGGRARLY
jgi:hypothetical protein